MSTYSALLKVSYSGLANMSSLLHDSHCITVV